MAQTNIKTTRLELIKTRNRIKIAAKGLNLLKMKRSSLVLAFFDLVKQIREMRGNMLESIRSAKDSIRLAEIMSGRMTLERVAAEISETGAKASSKNIMGVKIPSLEINKQYAANIEYELVSTSASIDDARMRYDELFKMLIEVAEKENSLRRLLHEIEKLNRRSNAIENVAIPRLMEKANYIKQRLDDMERDQIVSIKFIKGKINAQGEK